MNSVASKPALIGVDWGTSSFRAYLIGSDGAVLDRVSTSEGIMQVGDQVFEAVLDRLISPWTATAIIPIIASGMITSRNGWVETSYAQLPLGADGLAEALLPHDLGNGARIHFVTGAATEHPGGPDVMRGEETQIIGASALGLSEGKFVLPGTHSKWVDVEDGEIVNFSTYMSGEVFAALKEHTILGSLMREGDFEEYAFANGVEAGLNGASDLLHNLFHVRTLPLMDKIPNDAAADYLSGSLIGTEVASATSKTENKKAVTIVGRGDLTNRYEIALRIAGVRSQKSPDDVVAAGHYLIARTAGLI